MSWDLSKGGPAHDEIGLVHPGVSFASPSSRVRNIDLTNGQLCIGSENKFIESLICSFIQIGFAGYNTTI